MEKVTKFSPQIQEPVGQIPLFPTLVHYIHLANFPKEELVKFAYDEKDKDSKGCVISNQGGWQSSSYLYSRYENIIKTTIIDGCRPLFTNEDIFLENLIINLTFWININHTDCYNHAHMHEGADMAGILWVKIPEDSGQVELYNSKSYENHRLDSVYSEDYKRRWGFYPSYLIPPNEGTIILFPAHVLHAVMPNHSKEDRISIAFNVNLSTEANFTLGDFSEGTTNNAKITTCGATHEH